MKYQIKRGYFAQDFPWEVRKGGKLECYFQNREAALVYVEHKIKGSSYSVALEEAKKKETQR